MYFCVRLIAENEKMKTEITIDRSKGAWLKGDEWEQLRGGLPVYRGFSRPVAEDKITIYAPADRKPKNIPEAAHRIIDDWFLHRFGVRFRTQAVFGTGSLEKAIAHAGDDGEIGLISPNAEFAFCWSPQSYDLFGEYAQLTSDDQIADMLESLQFSAENLEQAVMSGHEIMLACDSFTIERMRSI